MDATIMDSFISGLRDKLTGEQDLTPEIFIKNISEVCDSTFQRKGLASGRRKPAYWWTTEIADIRKIFLSRKRTMTRLHKKPHITQEQQDTAQKLYKEERMRLKTAILRAKQSK